MAQARMLVYFQWVWWAAAFSPVPIMVGCALAVFAFWWQHRTVARTIQSTIDLLPQFIHRSHSNLSPESPHTHVQPDDCCANIEDAESARHAKKRRKSNSANDIGYRGDEKTVDAGPKCAEPLVSRIPSDDPIVDPTYPRTYRPTPIGRRTLPSKPTLHTAPSSSFSLFMSNAF